MAIVNKRNTDLQAKINKKYIKIVLLVVLTYVFYIFCKPAALITLIILIINMKSSKLRMYEQGAKGESYVHSILNRLDDSFNLFYDVNVIYDDKTSQLDSIIVGDNGVFVVEVKNINGIVTGDINDRNFTIEKIGQKGSRYYKEMYNPYKQVKTHAYRLSKYLQCHNIPCRVTGLVYFKCEKSEFERGNNAINISNSENIIFDNSEKLIERINSNYDNSIVTYKEEIIKNINILSD